MVVPLSSKVPVVADVGLILAEALHGRLLGDPRHLEVSHAPLLVDHVQLPPSITKLLDGEVQLDEAWWNEHELANNSVLAQLVLGRDRRVTLSLAGAAPTP